MLYLSYYLPSIYTSMLFQIQLLDLLKEHIQVVNTTSKNISDVAVEVSVWDLDGACQYYEVFDKLNVPSKTTLSTSEMKYPKSENPKPVYFLLLKLYKVSDNEILSRNFYWLHLPGGDYKLLEPYKKKQISLKTMSLTFIRGSCYEIRIHIQNTSKEPESRSRLHNNHPLNFDREREQSLLGKMLKNFSSRDNGVRVTEIKGTETGVAFFLHLSVHASKKDQKDNEDTRILPVHYSDNYFSLVPGEVMTVTLNFEVPEGVTPRVMIDGWNYEGGYSVV